MMQSQYEVSVETLHLAVRLWMVLSGGVVMNPKSATNRHGIFSDELRTVVGKQIKRTTVIFHQCSRKIPATVVALLFVVDIAFVNLVWQSVITAINWLP